MKKVVLITNIPTPYRIPLFNELNSQMNERGWELFVIFSSSGYKRRNFKIDYTEFNFNYTILDGGLHSIGADNEKTYFFYKGLWKTLKAEKPECIIVSGFSPASIQVALRSKLKGTPYVIWSGSIDKENRNTSWHRKVMRKFLIKHASSFVAYGSLAKKYLQNAGARSENICIGINTVDTKYFSSKTLEFRAAAVDSKTAIFTFTYIGYLVPRKNVHRVLEAAVILLKKRKDFKIRIIGDGVSKSSLEEECRKNHLENNIEFAGYIQKSELPEYLAKSQVVLFQTDFDIWGLVLNEAMAAGVPCMASKNAGATYDLIEDGKNGLITDFEDTFKTAEQMEWMMNNSSSILEMGKNAAITIEQKASLKISAKGFIHAIELSLKEN